MTSCNFVSLILTILIPSTISRGPHHPQGSHVVKRHTHYTPLNEKLTQDRELLQDKQHIQVIPLTPQKNCTSTENYLGTSGGNNP